ACRIFNVVYGKQSTRKHKTWEGDGFLEVGVKSVTLKDTDGKVLGQASCQKTAELTEGSRLFVGNKEIEGEMPEVVKKRTNDSDVNDDSSFEHKKKSKKSTPKLKPSSRITFTASRVDNFSAQKSNFTPLTLPRPDDEHQWTFNVNLLPVTDVIVDACVCRVLRPHQREGLVFLYRCVTGIRCLQYRGAILADEMGLGKTLQCVALIWTLLRQGPYGGQPVVKRALIVAPSSLVPNWDQEFSKWIGAHRMQTFVVDKNNKPHDYKKTPHIPVIIVSYEMFVRYYDVMETIDFELVICDEGHRLKNNSIRTATLLNNLPCKQRVILTGTPVQNDLQEYYALVDFVNTGILGSPAEFRKKFEVPIIASRNPQALEDVIREGEAIAEELNRITSGFILRRTQDILDTFLPKKFEYVLFCPLTELQNKIYAEATKYWSTILEDGRNTKETVAHLSVITALKKICNHPHLVRKDGDSTFEDESLTKVLNDIFVEFNAQEPLIEDSSKLQVVHALLKFLSMKKEKIVLVSNYTQTLDLLEALCEQHGFKYLRFDGSTPSNQRTDIVSRFNSPSSDCCVLLLSSKAGGVGLNLIGASRLVLFDSDWNPATDLQAMARIWREGQKKNVHIYRLLTSGTIEEKIFQRQLNKAGLNESIVDTSCTSDVKLSAEEMKDLFSFTMGCECLTHSMLECQCPGDGTIPRDSADADPEEVEEERECRLNLTRNTGPSGASSSLRMNQLYKWEHHARPISLQLLEVVEN
ncbi:hypothetical protein AAG570_006629, partial [Ranatra chinensis]